MPKKLKVFHGPVNFGTQAGLFARELRRNGIDAISVVSPSDSYSRLIDVELSRSNIFRRFLGNIFMVYCFFKYNTFHFYFGRTLFNNQRDLPFYKYFNKKVIMEHLGNDVRNYKYLIDKYEIEVSPKKVYGSTEENDRRNKKRIEYEGKYISYRLVCAPTHCTYVDADKVLPLAIDLDTFQYKQMKKDGNITILHAPTDRVFKGTKHVLRAIEQLKKEGFEFTFKLAEGITHNELLKEYEKCDIFIDQISVGWFATAALEAMATGRTTCAFINEEYYEHINYDEKPPIVNINKENVVDQLRNLLKRKDQLESIGKESRLFVEKYHDVKNLTKELIKIYEVIWENN